jgi:hypothetical protein
MQAIQTTVWLTQWFQLEELHRGKINLIDMDLQAAVIRIEFHSRRTLRDRQLVQRINRSSCYDLAHSVAFEVADSHLNLQLPGSCRLAAGPEHWDLGDIQEVRSNFEYSIDTGYNGHQAGGTGASGHRRTEGDMHAVAGAVDKDCSPAEEGMDSRTARLPNNMDRHEAALVWCMRPRTLLQEEEAAAAALGSCPRQCRLGGDSTVHFPGATPRDGLGWTTAPAVVAGLAVDFRPSESSLPGRKYFQ